MQIPEVNQPSSSTPVFPRRTLMFFSALLTRPSRGPRPSFCNVEQKSSRGLSRCRHFGAPATFDAPTRFYASPTSPESLISVHLSFSIPKTGRVHHLRSQLRSRATFHSPYFFPTVNSCLHLINYSFFAIRKYALYDGTFIYLNTFFPPLHSRLCLISQSFIIPFHLLRRYLCTLSTNFNYLTPLYFERFHSRASLWFRELSFLCLCPLFVVSISFFFFLSLSLSMINRIIPVRPP